MTLKTLERQTLTVVGLAIRTRPMSPEIPALWPRFVARIDEMWSDCRARFGKGGAFLFGAPCAADAMYAPVVSRFHTYDVAVGENARAYMQAVMALPAWAEWEKAAREETWILPRNEVDWPDAPRA